MTRARRLRPAQGGSFLPPTPEPDLGVIPCCTPSDAQGILDGVRKVFAEHRAELNAGHEMIALGMVAGAIGPAALEATELFGVDLGLSGRVFKTSKTAATSAKSAAPTPAVESPRNVETESGGGVPPAPPSDEVAHDYELVRERRRLLHERVRGLTTRSYVERADEVRRDSFGRVVALDYANRSQWIASDLVVVPTLHNCERCGGEFTVDFKVVDRDRGCCAACRPVRLGPDFVLEVDPVQTKLLNERRRLMGKRVACAVRGCGGKCGLDGTVIAIEFAGDHLTNTVIAIVHHDDGVDETHDAADLKVRA